MLGEPLRVDDAYEDGQSLDWGPARIRAIATPGHTDGSVSYLVEVDRRRVIFSGDTIYDRGQVWDLYSLQRGFARKQQRIGDYHGFLGEVATVGEPGTDPARSPRCSFRRTGG